MFDNKLGFFLSCDYSGRIIHAGADYVGILDEKYVETLYDIVKETSAGKVSEFLQQIKEKDIALLYEIELAIEDEHRVYNFFGGKSGDILYIIASISPQNIFTLYDELLRIINEQAAQIRKFMISSSNNTRGSGSGNTPGSRGTGPPAEVIFSGISNSVGGKVGNERDYPDIDVDAFTELTNSLSLAQRDLAQKNYQLKMQEERFSKIISHSLDAIIIVDNSRKVRFVNRAGEMMLQNKEEQLVGSLFSVSDYLTADSQEKEKEVEIVLSQKENKHAVCLVRSVNITWDGEDVTMYILTDITARKEMEKLKNDVDIIMRHDLKTPLNGIIGIPQLLMDDPNLTAEQKEYLQLLSESGKKMNDMIGNSLTILKIEQGSYRYTPVQFDILKVTRQVIADLEGFVSNNHSFITISTSGFELAEGEETPRGIIVVGEELLTYSIISNLLKNALESNKEQKPVTLTFNASGSAVVFSVHNHEAVPKEMIEQFFSKYSTTGKNNRGMGMGTYIVKKMAEVQGWTVDMETSPEEGTTVSICIPAG